MIRVENGEVRVGHATQTSRTTRAVLVADAASRATKIGWYGLSADAQSALTAEGLVVVQKQSGVVNVSGAGGFQGQSTARGAVLGAFVDVRGPRWSYDRSDAVQKRAPDDGAVAERRASKRAREK